MPIYTVCKLLSRYSEVINSYLNSFENAVDFYCAEKKQSTTHQYINLMKSVNNYCKNNLISDEQMEISCTALPHSYVDRGEQH